MVNSNILYFPCYNKIWVPLPFYFVCVCALSGARNDFRTFFIFLCAMCVCARSARKAPKTGTQKILTWSGAPIFLLENF